MTPNRTSLLATLAFPAFGLALGGVLSAGCKEPAIETKAVAASVAAIPVKTVPVQDIKVPRVLTLSGNLIGAEEARVAAGASGKVLATFVERGSVVKKGALLARLDARAATAMAAEAAAQVQQLKVQEEQAKLDCDRTQHLFDKGAISKADFDKAHSQCEATHWSVAAAEARKMQTADTLKDMEIRAPFNGLVVERLVTAGEYVRPDSAVVTLVDVDQLRVELTVPEADVAQVKPGLTVDFRTAGDKPGQVHRGRVRYIGPSVREKTRDAVVEAVVENASHDLRPGMFVSAELALGEQSLPGVPQAAVRADGSLRHVYVQVGDRLEDRIVQLGASRDNAVAVLNGVKAGEKVVSELTPDVRDGAKVK